MRTKVIAAIATTWVWLICWPIFAQRIQFPPATGLRPIDSGQPPAIGTPVMVPINPATQSGIYPSNGYGSASFDPYASAGYGAPGFAAIASPVFPPANGGAVAPYGSYPAYTGAQPPLPGSGPSAVVGTFPSTSPNYSQPGMYPNSTPSALYPGAYGSTNSGGSLGSIFSDMYTGVFGGTPQPNYNGALVPPGTYPPAYGTPGGSTWNPQGSVFNTTPAYPQFVRLFQGPRFRHAFIYGSNDPDALMINDSDLSLAFLIPNFLFSTQPLYLMPSFSLHQWDGPKPDSAADLPALAYSAFLDSGWQSDPARILGAELGLRIGWFTDFDTGNADSLRIMGRAIGRVRITPRATLKLGVLYLDRNKTKLLPAGGILWQPNQDTRFDLFFPEPKLSHYLSTLGNTDTWWYAGGYYGGGSWTIQRADASSDSIDINDLRLVFGFEWGRNEQIREGRRYGFLEFGYVFDRELLFKDSPADDLSLQDTIMVRAGFGY